MFKNLKLSIKNKHHWGANIALFLVGFVAVPIISVFSIPVQIAAYYFVRAVVLFLYSLIFVSGIKNISKKEALIALDKATSFSFVLITVSVLAVFFANAVIENQLIQNCFYFLIRSVVFWLWELPFIDKTLIAFDEKKASLLSALANFFMRGGRNG
jgi:hypothetical protein